MGGGATVTVVTDGRRGATLSGTPPMEAPSDWAAAFGRALPTGGDGVPASGPVGGEDPYRTADQVLGLPRAGVQQGEGAPIPGVPSGYEGQGFSFAGVALAEGPSVDVRPGGVTSDAPRDEGSHIAGGRRSNTLGDGTRLGLVLKWGWLKGSIP